MTYGYMDCLGAVLYRAMGSGLHMDKYRDYTLRNRILGKQ